MSALDCSAAHIQWRADNFIHAQRFDHYSRTDDVNHRVRGPYFVKVDTFDVTVVNFGFGGTERFENRNRRVLRTLADGRLADHFANFFQPAAVLVLVWLTRPSSFASSLGVVVLAQFHWAAAVMIMRMIVAVFLFMATVVIMFPGMTVLRPENLARQLFFPVDIDVELRRRNPASIYPREFQPGSDI